MKKMYACNDCNLQLPSDSFSKSQINKLEHNKVTSIKCAACTAAQVLRIDGPGKKKALEVVDEPKKAMESIQLDPSMKYIKNPENTPIINDAKVFAKLHGTQYSVRVNATTAWRTVVKMAVRGVVRKNKKGKETVLTAIGLFKPGSHTVVACTDSAAHRPRINEALRCVEASRKRIGVEGYIEGTGYDDSANNSGSSATAHCYLKYVLLVLARESNKVQLSLVWNTEPTGNVSGDLLLNTFVADLLSLGISDKNTNPTSDNTCAAVDNNLFHSIWVNYNPSSRYNNAITGRETDSWRLLYGDQYCREIVHTDMPTPPQLLFPPFVFRQANICAFTYIICNIRTWIKQFAAQMCATAESSEQSQEVSGKRRAKLSDIENINAGNKKKQRKESSAASDETADDIGGGGDAMQQQQLLLPTGRLVSCVELYAGVGTIGLNCLDLLSVLSCSDENPHNLACFEAARLAMRPEALGRRASYLSLPAAKVALQGGLRGYELVIVDPPRKGLDEEVLQALLHWDEEEGEEERGKHNTASLSKNNASSSGKRVYFGEDGVATTISVPSVTDSSDKKKTNNRRLIYVSCGFPAFKRDAARLLGLTDGSGGGNVTAAGATATTGVYAGSNSVRHWRLVHTEGHVLFPGSDHVETLAIFDRL